MTKYTVQVIHSHSYDKDDKIQQAGIRASQALDQGKTVGKMSE